MGNTNTKPFGVKDKIGYMCGDIANDFTFIFASSYVMVFYTKVMGVSAGMVGTMFLLARCLDAVSYTHLDVYKRQGQDLPAILNRFLPARRSAREKKGRTSIWQRQKHLARTRDGYKRQIQS